MYCLYKKKYRINTQIEEYAEFVEYFSLKIIRNNTKIKAIIRSLKEITILEH